MDQKKCLYCGEPFTPRDPRQRYCDRTHYTTCPVCGKTSEVKHRQYLGKPAVACSSKCRIEMMRRTSMERYGVPSPGNSPSARAKAKATLKARTGYEHPMQSPAAKAKANESRARHNPTLTRRTNRIKAISALAMERPRFDKVVQITDTLNAHGVAACPDWVIDGIHFDLGLPEQKKVLLYATTFTNSIQHNPHIYPQYHKDLVLFAEEHGYACFIMFDWDNADLVAWQFLPKQANMMEEDVHPEVISPTAANQFFEYSCLEGPVTGIHYAVGMVRNGLPFQVMAFGFPRRDKSRNVEILRMATHRQVNVMNGSYAQLLDFAKNEFNLTGLITHCNRAQSTGAELKALGMTEDKWAFPRKYWVFGDTGQRIWDDTARQKKMNPDQLIQDGWSVIYDAGCATYLL